MKQAGIQDIKMKPQTIKKSRRFPTLSKPLLIYRDIRPFPVHKCSRGITEKTIRLIAEHIMKHNTKGKSCDLSNFIFCAAIIGPATVYAML